MEREEKALAIWRDSVVIRPIMETDSLEELTELLHRAYRPLAEMGLRFFATYQTPADTRERITGAYCLVGLKDGELVATITYYGPQQSNGPDWYNRPDVAHFGQFAVDPTLKQEGLGGLLLSLVEEHARQCGIKELALDTSEKATHLIEYYTKKGFRFIQYHQWGVTNYRSVVMSKKLC